MNQSIKFCSNNLRLTKLIENKKNKVNILSALKFFLLINTFLSTAIIA